MPRLRLLLILLSLLLLAIVLWRVFMPWSPAADERARTPVIAASPDSAQPDPHAATLANRPAFTFTDEQAAVARNADSIPAFCRPNASENPAALRQFRQQNPELALADSDLQLLLAEAPELQRLTAMAFTDHDSRSQTVLTPGPYQGHDVRRLEADAIGGNPDAAMIFGSYLMFSAYQATATASDPIDHETMARGSALLMQAYQTGSREALSRLYVNTQMAARILWRRSGRSAEWQALHAEQYALEQWFLQQGPSHAAAALIQYERDISHAPLNPLGEPYPDGSELDANQIARRVQELSSELATDPLTASEQQQREQLLWLQRRGHIEPVLSILFKACSQETLNN